MPILADIASLEPGALVELFDLDMSVIGGDVVHFHAGTNYNGQAVVWGGVVYQPFPIMADGFDQTGSGPFPRPTLTVANVDGTITALVLEYQDLIDCKVTRRQTFAKYLDPVNFADGNNPSADSTQELPQEIYYIARRAAETGETVTFELANAVDRQGVRLPSRTVFQRTCTWQYKGAECGYVPGPMFDITGASVTDPALDVCSHLLSTGCKLRFYGKAGTSRGVVLPFGGFPGSGSGQSVA